jgi:hypothetical protein
LFAVETDGILRDELALALQAYLQRKLAPAAMAGSKQEPTPIAVDLGLPETCSFEGVSQVAIGADLLFTRACLSLGIPQRIFLPLPAEEYLSDSGSDGASDFSAAEANASAALLASEHIVECRIVGDSPDRETRFEQTNQAIAAASDVILCVRALGAVARPGGTAQLLGLAAESRMPALELCITGDNGVLNVTERWFNRN